MSDISEKYPVRLGHTVRVQQPDGSIRVECDHTFKGDSRCCHCGVPFSQLNKAWVEGDDLEIP